MSHTSSKRNLIILVVIGLLVFAGYLLVLSGESEESEAYEHTELTVGGSSIDLLISDTEVLRVQGLSGRSALPENTGMLFVFEEEGRHGFWMRDMHFSIDIIWLDSNKRVVTLEENVAPESYPEIFEPTEDALYVIELAAGRASELGIEVGDILTFDYSPSGNSI